jgi:hypothetical protein
LLLLLHSVAAALFFCCCCCVAWLAASLIAPEFSLAQLQAAARRDHRWLAMSTEALEGRLTGLQQALGVRRAAHPGLVAVHVVLLNVHAYGLLPVVYGVWCMVCSSMLAGDARGIIVGDHRCLAISNEAPEGQLTALQQALR